MYNWAVPTRTVSEARATLPELLDRVGIGQEVTITRHGKPVAVLVRPDTLRVRRANEVEAVAEAVHDALERGRRTPLSETPSMSPEYAEGLIEEIRAGRSRGR